MKSFNKVAIIGVGLIGGSIGLALKRRRVAGRVIGVFRKTSTLKRALRRKAVDEGFMDVRSGVKDADLIIISSPVMSIPGLVSDAARYAKRGAIITDAGSTKGWIVKTIEKRLGKRRAVKFIGSHPMAGSERTGVDNAVADLFCGSPCIVTRTLSADKAALGKVVKLWRALGAKVSIMSPGEHDRAISLVSHLPHIAAFGVAGAVGEKDIRYAAEGFRDVTRVASSDAELWADIFLTNRIEAARAVKLFEGYVSGIMRAIKEGDRARLVKLLKLSKVKRDKLVYAKKG